VSRGGQYLSVPSRRDHYLMQNADTDFFTENYMNSFNRGESLHEDALSTQHEGEGESYSSPDEEDSYSSSEDPSLFDDDETMTIEDVAKLLGSMKFDNSESSRDVVTSSSITTVEEEAAKLKKAQLVQLLLSMLPLNGFDDCDLVAHDKVPSGFFHEITEENIKAYTTEVLTAVRTNNINELKRLHSEGHSMQCCNKFGESILHLACRRGFTGIVRFLLEDASISFNIRDDYGRTPFHDACWVSSTDFDLIDLLLKESPDLLFIKDKRGFSPLQYVTNSSYAEWSDFLNKRKDLIVPKYIFGDRVLSCQ